MIDIKSSVVFLADYHQCIESALCNIGTVVNIINTIIYIIFMTIIIYV